VAVLGRLHQYNSVPGLRTELDRLYNFLQTMASKELAAHQIDGTGASVDDHRSRVTSGPETVQSLKVGVGDDVREICGFKRFKVPSVGDSVANGGVPDLPGNDAEDDTVTIILSSDATHPINNLTEGDSIVVYRVPWADDVQLTPFLYVYPGAERLKVVVSNHSTGEVAMEDGNWWVFVTEYCADT
tara:strand:- start:19 stop:576 length:558 start_codon:yes stop_codon:yes gene_type:complete